MAKETQRDFLPPDVCPALLTKTMLLNTEYRRSAQEDASFADLALFYCMKTLREYGPDEDDCEPEGCRPGRSCWCGDDPA